MRIKYSKFEVDTSLELPLNEWHEILCNEYFKHHIHILTKDNRIRISKEELFYSQVEGLLSGNEEQATEALRSIIFNIEDKLHELMKAL